MLFTTIISYDSLLQQSLLNFSGARRHEISFSFSLYAKPLKKCNRPPFQGGQKTTIEFDE
jgi:hypothetical protein